jgi:hypothetical protein
MAQTPKIMTRAPYRYAVGVRAEPAFSEQGCTKSPLERYFRDVQVLRHHVVGAETGYKTVGQVYLDLPPEFPALAL